MEVTVRWFTESKYPSFNVSLATQPGKEPFLDIKGCRLVNGEKGEFVGWPATKNQTTGKYWNHVYASNDFASVVLEKAKESQPKSAPAERASRPNNSNFDDFDSDIPF